MDRWLRLLGYSAVLGASLSVADYSLRRAVDVIRQEWPS